MARVPYVGESALPTEQQDLLVSALQGKERNIYRAIGNNPDALYGLRTFLGALWCDSGLDPEQRELVILAVTCEIESAEAIESVIGVNDTLCRLRVVVLSEGVPRLFGVVETRVLVAGLFGFAEFDQHLVAGGVDPTRPLRSAVRTGNRPRCRRPDPPIWFWHSNAFRATYTDISQFHPC